ncbi:MAG: hypothetical protein PHE92_09240 [Candidatus Cloacimonetes bacterium]|nr:hypothetical protein [Candidatus Cloacimonadota bacterium]
MTPEEKEQELVKNVEHLLFLLKDTEAHTSKELNQTFEKIKKLLDPNFSSIPADLKKSIGLATVASVASDPELRVDIVRGGLSLLRTAVRCAGGPFMDENLQKILDHEKSLSMKLRMISPESDSPIQRVDLYDAAWRAVSYLEFMCFNGYGEINTSGYKWGESK